MYEGRSRPFERSSNGLRENDISPKTFCMKTVKVPYVTAYFTTYFTASTDCHRPCAVMSAIVTQ